MELLTIPAMDGLHLSAAVYKAADPIGLVQVIHGAKEHKGRYDHFCRHLQQEGFAVIASDNRGHGASINEDYPLGYMDGPERIVDDQRMITHYIKNLYPNKELSLFGHSLGSLFARMYIQRYDTELTKLILSGTANYVTGVNLGIRLGEAIARMKGKSGYSKLLSALSGIEREDLSWLSRNKENIKAVQEDPLYVDRYPIASLLTLFKADSELHRLDKYECNNPGLSILSVTGEEDPITGSSRGLKDSLSSLQKVGYRDITNAVYTNMRHELLNETNREWVYNDIIRFLKK